MLPILTKYSCNYTQAGGDKKTNASLWSGWIMIPHLDRLSVDHNNMRRSTQAVRGLVPLDQKYQLLARKEYSQQHSRVRNLRNAKSILTESIKGLDEDIKSCNTVRVM